MEVVGCIVVVGLTSDVLGIRLTEDVMGIDTVFTSVDLTMLELNVAGLIRLLRVFDCCTNVVAGCCVIFMVDDEDTC